MTRAAIDALLRNAKEAYCVVPCMLLQSKLVEAIETLTTWRPMDTAPRDGARILIYYGPQEWSIRVAQWHEGVWRCAVWRHGFADVPLGWRPLPLPPADLSRAVGA